MILTTTNKLQRLLLMSFFGPVTAEEVRQGRNEVRTLLADLEPGFRVLTDLERLHVMEPDCAAEIGHMMDYLKERGVQLVVRIIPHPAKDPGLGILSTFHYGRKLRTVTCKDLAEAAQVLQLGSKSAQET